ncbi:TIGR04348 family glycosyltransferase [Acidobacteria bacterium AH-259-A15]|nr:TIGR04348 family glycosyltransferase [Acidobacteria bacterium AH-259-A15]
MRIRLITPSPKAVLDGNRVTARRWARILRDLDHQVIVQNQYDGDSCHLLIALHAFKSFESVRQFREHHLKKPLIVVLTGTDLYRDLEQRSQTRCSLKLATRLIVLQKQAFVEVPESFREKTRVIYQSAEPVKGEQAPPKRYFRVCVVGNLRPEKDPFRAALASHQLAVGSRIRILQVGQALSREMEKRALHENRTNPRYRWLGSLPHGRTRRLVAGSHLVALTSRMEGSSNVLSEALISSVPVVASRIPGLVGTLGENYQGYFPVGDTKALARLLRRTEMDREFYQELKAHCTRVAPLVHPQRERASWQRLLEEIWSKKELL